MQGKKPVVGYLLATFPSITETFVLREIASLRDRGFEIVVFAVKRAGRPDVERSLLDGEASIMAVYSRPDNVVLHFLANLRALFTKPIRYVKTLSVFIEEATKVHPKEAGRILYHFYCGIGFQRQFKKYEVDHLHAHFTAGGNVSLAAHLFNGQPFSFTAHASGDIFMNPILLEKKVRHAAFVIPVCEYSRSYLNSVTGYKYVEKMNVVHNGVDLDEPSRLIGYRFNERNRSSRNGLRIVSVGSLIRVKGHATLVFACKALSEAGFKLKCEIIGDGPEKVTLARLIDEAGLPDLIELSGARSLSSVYTALAEADVFALLSEIDVNGYRDGFPTVLLEAMVMALPVVATWISGIPEIVEDGVTGFLVPERSPEAAAAALGSLLRDEQLRSTMGQAGRRRVEERFSLGVSADSRANVFRRFLCR